MTSASPEAPLTEPNPDPASASSPSTPEATRVSASPRGRGPLRVLGLLGVLAVLGSAGAIGWQWWEQRTELSQRVASQDAALAALRAQSDTLSARLEEQSTRLADQSRLTDRNGTDIAALQSRIEDTLALMSRISEDLSGGRTRFQLAAVEHLLVIANDRLQLEHDLRAALIALEAADQRLAALSDPQLFAVREALAQERAALRAVPVADLTSAALTLSSLVERAPRLPLVSHAPSQFHSPEVRSRAEGATSLAEAGWRRVVAAVGTAVSSLFTIRREDNARALRLLPPESEAVIYKVLVLKLESARMALLTGNTVAFRESLHSAANWLETEFKPEDPGVLAVRGELGRLETLDLSPPLPDISRSLAVLRSRLDAAP